MDMSDVILPKLPTLGWTIYRGSDVALQVSILNANNNTSEIVVGTEFGMQVRAIENDVAPVLLDLNMADGITAAPTTGLVTVEIDAVETLPLAAGRYYAQMWSKLSGKRQPRFRVEIDLLERSTII